MLIFIFILELENIDSVVTYLVWKIFLVYNLIFKSNQFGSWGGDFIFKFHLKKAFSNPLMSIKSVE